VADMTAVCADHLFLWHRSIFRGLTAGGSAARAAKPTESAAAAG
jgi:hypothetical protein